MTLPAPGSRVRVRGPHPWIPLSGEVGTVEAVRPRDALPLVIRFPGKDGRDDTVLSYMADEVEEV